MGQLIIKIIYIKLIGPLEVNKGTLGITAQLKIQVLIYFLVYDLDVELEYTYE